MQRNFIIGAITGFIIIVFTFLYLDNYHNKPPKSEMQEISEQYKGKTGVVFVSMPKFLISNFFSDEKLKNIQKEYNVHLINLLILHKKKDNSGTDNLKVKNDIMEALITRQFQVIETEQEMQGEKHILAKEYPNNWNESIMIFSSDSSLFVFDMISDVKTTEVSNIAKEMSTMNIPFN